MKYSLLKNKIFSIIIIKTKYGKVPMQLFYVRFAPIMNI